jgi:para-nitrobenzyl esterase
MNIRLFICLCISPGLVLAGNPKSVKIADGLISGVTLKSGVRAFKGIPFAAPPVGPLRWKEPQPSEKWTGIRKAESFGSPCMQQSLSNQQH